jgi:hypothetical protein
MTPNGDQRYGRPNGRLYFMCKWRNRWDNTTLLIVILLILILFGGGYYGRGRWW